MNNREGHRARKRLKHQLDIWVEGEYVDLWTIVHFVAGILLGYSPIILPWPFMYVLCSAIVIIVMWEVYEHIAGIHETFGNRVVDIVAGIGGLFTTIVAYPILTPFFAWVSGLSLLMLYIFMCVSGWRAYRKRRELDIEHKQSHIT